MPNSFDPPNSSGGQQEHQRALRFLCLTIFLLMADPLMNVYVGPAPLYPIDLLAFLTWICASRIRSRRRYPLQKFVIFILIAMIASELFTGVLLRTLIKPIYLIVRISLSISLYFSTSKIIQRKSDLVALIKAGLLGAIITATLMITSSLPQTQGIVAHHVFSHSFLLPSADHVAAMYMFVSIAMRGQSLVGMSILSAAFLNTIWPLLFLLRTDEELGTRWKVSTLFAMFLIPLGIILSYSRGAVAGLVMVVLIVALLNSNKVRQPLVLGVGIAILIFSWAGWGSEYFKFEWFQNKSLYQFAHIYQSSSMTQRIYAYSEPFRLVADNPAFIVLGQGFARQKIAGASWVGYHIHSVFAAATYGYGMLAAFAYFGLLLGAFRITWGHAFGAKDEFLAVFSRALLASLFGFSSWFLLGLASVSEPRGAMLLFFVFGLVAAQSNFAGSSAPERQKQRPFSHRKGINPHSKDIIGDVP